MFLKIFKTFKVLFLIEKVFLKSVFQYTHFLTNPVILLSEEYNFNSLMHSVQ